MEIKNKLTVTTAGEGDNRGKKEKGQVKKQV